MTKLHTHHFRLHLALFSFLATSLVILFTPVESLAATYQVKYDGVSFTPSVSTIRPGDSVNWTNQSSNFLELASDPHPQHTNYPPLNLGLINTGQSKSLTFPTVGTFGFHNHLRSSATGIVIVAIPASPTPRPSASDLKNLIYRYLSPSDSDLHTVDGKVNLMDIGYLWQRVSQ